MDFESMFSNLEIDDPELNNKCSVISGEIQSGKCTIVTVIEQLGILLINKSIEKRELGVLVLSEVLKSLPLDFLNSQQCEVISTFYIDKLKEHHQIVPVALKGTLRIVEFDNFPKQHIPLMLTALFHNIACQQQQQADRYNIYSIFKILLDKYPSDLLLMGVDLVYGILSSIEGERDPRNLLYLFDWIKAFLKVVPLGHLDEEMFEVLACYFPVDFKTPPNNTQITRENLSEALCATLSSIPEFGQYCIPLALEKLDSSLQIAKNDSLKLLVEGCENFLAATYMEFSYKIWSQLQKEIFTCNNSFDEIKYLNSLTTIIDKLSHANEPEFKSFLKNIVDMMKGNLLPDTKHFKISTTILVCVARGSQYSSNYVIKEIAPILTNTYNITKASVHKTFILRSLVELAKAFLYHQNINLLEHEEISNIILLCCQAMLDLSTDLKSEAFTNMSDIVTYLPADTRMILYRNLQTFLTKPEPEIVKTAIIKCFQALATSYGDEVQANVINKINIQDLVSLNFYLNAICELAALKQFREIVVDILIQRINENIEWSNVAIKNIKLLLEKNRNVEILEVFYQKHIINILIEFSLKYLTANQVPDVLFIDISVILKFVIGSKDSENQKQVISQLGAVYSCIETKEEFVILLSGLISGLHRDVDINYEIPKNLFYVASKTRNEVVFHVTVQLIASIINKKPEDELLLNFLQNLKNECLELLKNDVCKGVFTLSWVSKALVMRNHSQSFLWVDTLLQLIDEHPEVAQGFKIIMDDSYENMSTDSHCIKMLLYRQKVFTYVTNKLMSEFPMTHEPKFVLLSNLLEYAPEQVVLLNFKKISRMVILGLEKCREGQVVLVFLKIVKKFTSTKNEVIEEHLDDFLTRILNLSSFTGSMKVRIEALKCLVQFISSYPIYKLLPFKPQALNHLALCTDDKKRLVRKEAMEARSLWFLLDAPI